MKKLHVDIETYSSVDIKKAGAYKYIESPDFEMLLVAYALDDRPIKVVDLASLERLPSEFTIMLKDPNIEKWAHNAVFERLAFKRVGFDIPIEQWHCSSVLAAYCGLPLSLAEVSKALQLEEKGKLSTGKALIKYFCCPVKPTKVNGGRIRNYPFHDAEKWEEFKRYCVNDVEAERAITQRLSSFVFPKAEIQNYIIDQEINDRGVQIDQQLACNAIAFSNEITATTIVHLKNVTGLTNPNSPAQLKKWLSEHMQKEINTLAKDVIPELIEEAGAGVVSDVLQCRQLLAKTSVKKYEAMLNCVCSDGRAHGLFQFRGATRTGRWAGRLIQLQNLPQNHLEDLQGARDTLEAGDYELASMLYDSIPNTLSELIRTALVAPKGKTFVVADYSAIEARVLAWIAGEIWRNEVFASHGKIYEASASMMFGVPIELIDKGSDLRKKGKVAELALGYQGALGALEKMGGSSMGLSREEMKTIVLRWRKANPAIVRFWFDVDKFAKLTVKTGQPHSMKHLRFHMKQGCLCITLPSGNDLVYRDAKIGVNRFGNESIVYKGIDDKKQWAELETYGGKLTENIVQGLSRDILALAMLRLRNRGYQIVMHVHDEAISEVPEEQATQKLETMCEVMGEPIPFTQGLILTAEGYVTPFYKKD